MTPTGKEPYEISLTEASELTENYRNSVTTGDTIALYFGGDAIQKILDQEGCVGVRFYYATGKTGSPQLVVVGVDASGNDLYTGLIADKAIPCPQVCSAPNPLNS